MRQRIRAAVTLRRDLQTGRAVGALALCATALALATVAALIGAPRATAEDNFVLRNETGKTITPTIEDGFEEDCWYDATGVFDPETGSAGLISSITAEAHLFECDSGWGTNLAYDQTPLYLHRENGERYVYFWEGGVGAVNFWANDPWIGGATMGCSANPGEWAEANGMSPIGNFMTAEADGRTCTIAWLPGVGGSTQLGLASPSSRAYAGHVRLVDSLASVLGGRAKVAVQVFGLGSARHRVTVSLRTRSGRHIGSGSRVLKVGDRSRVVDVALSPAAARELSRRHELEVKAAAVIDSRGGTGDTTTQLLLRRGVSGRR